MNARLSSLVLLGSALVTVGCGDALVTEGDGPPPEARSTTSKAISCWPEMSRFPVNAPHNIGYDGASCGSGACDISCPDQNANSDYGGPHHGVDVFAFYRAPIVAVASGTIRRVGWPSSTSGLRVVLSDGCGWWYYYGHLDEAVVSEGQWVDAGQLIGFMGHSGAPSTHLHFNVSADGDYYNDIDPFPLLQATSGTSCGPPPVPPAPADVPFWFTGGNQRVGKNADGRLEVFGRGLDHGIWNQWQPAPSAGPWSGWSPMGGGLTSEPVVGSNADGRLEMFAVGFDYALYHRWQNPWGGWSDWVSLGGVLTSEPAVGRNADGRLEVFARGTDGALWHAWQVAPNGSWSAWDSLGGGVTSVPVVVLNAQGQLQVFARGNDGAVWFRTQSAYAWTDWASLGGQVLFAPAVALNQDGRLEIFAWGTDRALWHAWQSTPGGPIGGWVSLGGNLTSHPAVARNADGRLEVFARGSDDALWHLWQLSPGGAWSSWASEGGVLTSAVQVASNSNGGLEVFVRGGDNALYLKWQGAFGWSDWVSLGGVLLGF
jgi:uncharacterized protein GlcG (DUF336 family)